MIRDGDHIARLVEQEAPSPNHGVCMCAGMGMNGTDVLEAVDRFQGKIFFAQPRDLKGTWPQVEEVMPGEGDIDVKEFLRRLHAGGYAGLVNPEHFEDTKRPSADPRLTPSPSSRTGLTRSPALRVEGLRLPQCRRKTLRPSTKSSKKASTTIPALQPRSSQAQKLSL